MLKNKIVSYNDYQKLSETKKRRGTHIVELPSIWMASDKDDVTSMYIKNLDVGYKEHYGTPDYECKEYELYSDSAIELAKFDNNDLHNGLGLTYIITIFRKKLSSDDGEQIKRQEENTMWQNKMKGASNQGRFILDRVTPLVDKQGKPTNQAGFMITTIPDNNNTGRHSDLRSNKNIVLLTAHGIVEPKIAGIPNLSSGNGFSNQMEFLIAALEEIDNGIISEYSVLECQELTKLLNMDGIRVAVKRKKSLPLYRSMSDKLMEMVLLDDEIRSIFGFEGLTQDQKIDLSKRVSKAVNDRQQN